MSEMPKQPRKFIPTNFNMAQPFLPTVPAPMQADEPKKATFNFPDGGWECSKCQNYNFKGRKSCHRCKKVKCENDIEGKPDHMSMPAEKKQALKSQAKANRKMQRAKKVPADCMDPNADRSGDWVCQKCSNHNYSFRNFCNKCSMTYEESQQMQRAYEDGARFLNMQLNLGL